MIENAMASGISASATTSPAKTSFRVLENHSWRIVSMDLYFFVDCRAVRAGANAGFESVPCTSEADEMQAWFTRGGGVTMSQRDVGETL